MYVYIHILLFVGGSLTVQIFGSLSSDKSLGDKNKRKKLEKPQVSEQQNNLSASPVIINSRKDVSDLLK